MEQKEFDEIVRRLKCEFDRKYVKKDECERQIEEFDDKITKGADRIAALEIYTKIILGILSATGIGVLSIVLEVFKG